MHDMVLSPMQEQEKIGEQSQSGQALCVPSLIYIWSRAANADKSKQFFDWLRKSPVPLRADHAS